MSLQGSEAQALAGEDVGHYGGSYKVTYDLYKKYGDTRLLDTPICGAPSLSLVPQKSKVLKDTRKIMYFTLLIHIVNLVALRGTSGTRCPSTAHSSSQSIYPGI